MVSFIKLWKVGVTIFIDDEILALKPAETCPEPGGSDSKDNAFPIGPCLLSASLFHLEFLSLWVITNLKSLAKTV